MDKYIAETPMLNYSHASIQLLIQSKKWKELDTFECINAIYSYVRDEIIFGYNVDDSIPASKV